LGQDALASWLLAPADPATVRARQAAIDELRGQLDLREEFAVLDEADTADLAPKTLPDWAVAPPVFLSRLRPLAAIVLAAASVTALLATGFYDAPTWPFLLVAAVQGALLLSMRAGFRRLTGDIDRVIDEIKLLREVLRIVEDYQPQSERLRELLGRLREGSQAPSRRIAQLVRLVESWETIRRNQFVVPFAFVLMLAVHVAYAIERWRAENRRLVAAWLEVVAEFEALGSLARFAYERPAYPFPEIAETGPCFEAQALGHPLIAARARVTNDVALARERSLLLVSGSNMSGKSTLLRAVGLNAVLALAGAPVVAARLQVSPLAVGSAMRHTDSLQEGVSAFYAEIQRLRLVCDLTSGPLPVLFLLDEILHGTNSHDRRIGAEVVIESLLRSGAIGLVTTHDLALTEIVERWSPRAANVHFEDQLRDGRLSFDYRLRGGPVPRGNGLILMRLLGFPVPEGLE
jgi:hypothetical protein